MDSDVFDPWWREGVCAQIGSDLFFVGQGQSVLEAQKACRMCTVRLQCLTDALESDVDYGVFGGFAPPYRRMLRLQVTAGKEPVSVARKAIHEETYRKRRVQWNR